MSRIRPILAGFIERYPKIKLELDLEDRNVDMVAEGFGVLIRASGKLDDSSLISRRVIINSPGMELALCIAGQGITRLLQFNLNGEIESGELIALFPDLPRGAIRYLSDLPQP